MADLMQFDLVSPERKLASVEASSVQIPGADGDLTAMADHAPLITTLRPGILTVEGPEGTMEYVVTGGFADVAGPSVSVLAERAMPKADVTGDVLAELISDAEAKHAAATDTAVDVAAKLVADLNALKDSLGA